MICDGCGKLLTSDKCKDEVWSIKHKHVSASKIEKRIQIFAIFVDPKTHSLMKLCRKCQEIAIGGMNSGKMFK